MGKPQKSKLTTTHTDEQMDISERTENKEHTCI